MKLEKKTVYKVKTQMEYDAMMSDAERQGFTWLYGEKATSRNYWNEYKDKTIIYVEKDNTLAYGPDEDLPLASEYGYAIKDYKRDDVVEIKPGCFCVEADDFETAQRKMKEHLAKENEEESYTITINGRDVTVVTPDGKTATAHCHPDDEFDIAEGVRIALEKIERKNHKLTMKEFYVLDFLDDMDCDTMYVNKGYCIGGERDGETIIELSDVSVEDLFDWLDDCESYNIDDLMELDIED